jgi:methionine-rich copper-binding protein CopC
MLAGTSALLFLSAISATAQTNPAPQSIPYLQDFGTSTFTTAPAGFAVWNGLNGGTINSQLLAEGSAPTGNATLAAASAAQTGGGAFGYAADGNAKLYIQTSSNNTNGVNQPVLALNTTGKTNITLSYDVDSISAQARSIGIVCQFRVGNSGLWTTIFPTTGLNPYSQTAGTTGLKTTVNATLPAAAEDKTEVQIRWGVWRGSESGNSSGLAIDNISVTTTTSGPDIVAPIQQSFTPADGATSINENSNLVITFNETIQKGTGNIIIKKTSDNRTVETINVTSDAVTASVASLTINPSLTLDFSTSYYVTIDANAVRDNATTPNNFAGISEATTWNFTTRNAPIAGLVISEVYGGGGNGSAAFTNDFVELYNSTASSIDLAGYSIQYASAAGTFNSTNKLDLTGNIPAGAYYLIQLASSGSVGSSLPSPSVSGGINLSGSAGKVALVSTTTSIASGGPSDPNVVDFVGYGTTANQFEGLAPTIAPTSASSVTRNSSNADTNDNAADFALAIPPTPQNTTGAADTVAPTVNALNPGDNSTTGNISQNLSITFGEPVVKGTGNIVIYLSADASVVATIPVTDPSVTVAGNVVTINPATDLLNTTAYFVNIAAGAFEDAAGNDYVGITNATSWNFTTEALVVPGTLVAGDIAFVAFTASSDDHFAFVALKTIPAGEVIRFTDNEWNGSPVGNGGAFNSGEGFIAWTAPLGGVTQGTIVRIDDISTSPLASVGTIEIVSGSLNISSSSITGDTVYAYQGGIASPNSVLAVVANTTVNDSILGTGLTASNTIYLPASLSHYQYTGARSGQGAFSAYLALIADTTTNWTAIPEFQDAPTNLIPNDPATVFLMNSFILGTSSFSNWASSNGATSDPLADHDGDGVKNAVEYFMGQTGSSFTTMPSVMNGAVTWVKDSSANASYVIKTSADLMTWTTAPTGVVDNGSRVIFTLPTGQAKIFVRLEVTVP